MRIDAHNHFWKFDPVRDAWIDESMSVIRRDFLPEDLESVLSENGIDGTIAVQADQSDEETHFLLDLADKNTFIKGVVGWIDLRSPKVEWELDKYRRIEKLCGFRHIVQSEKDNMFLVREEFLRGLRCLSKYNFTYDILVFPHQLPSAIKLVDKLPDQKFVLDHIAKPLIRKGVIEPWASQLEELAASPNVYCKISGIITEADHKNWTPEEIRPYLDVVFSVFGTNRVMFGSDWPVCLLAGNYSEVLKLIEDYTRDLKYSDKKKIFGSNAMEFYGIDSNNTK